MHESPESTQPASQPLTVPIEQAQQPRYSQPSPFSTSPAPVKHRSIWWVVATLVLLFIVLSVSISLAYQAGKNSAVLEPGTVQRTPGGTVLVTTPISTPFRLLDTATIGGTAAAFQTAYGSGSDAGFDQTYTVTQPGLMALVTATLLGHVSADGVEHVVSLRIQPFSGDWDVATATPICARFIPTDAIYQKMITVAGKGSERVYQSAALANVFDPSLFVEKANGTADTPGTFSMELGPAFPDNTGCILVLGT